MLGRGSKQSDSSTNKDVSAIIVNILNIENDMLKENIKQNSTLQLLNKISDTASPATKSSCDKGSNDSSFTNTCTDILTRHKSIIFDLKKRIDVKTSK